MTDPIDRANDTAQFNNDLAIQQHLIDHTLPAQLIVDGVVECIDCGDEIPVERLAALPNCVRCIDCQTMYEIRERQ
ncbi:MAG: TraR/DksA family transcriptional regulator [Burkholderiaceae bacterium]